MFDPETHSLAYIPLSERGGRRGGPWGGEERSGWPPRSSGVWDGAKAQASSLIGAEPQSRTGLSRRR